MTHLECLNKLFYPLNLPTVGLSNGQNRRRGSEFVRLLLYNIMSSKSKVFFWSKQNPRISQSNTITLSAATEAPTKLGMRWWTGRGFWAKFCASMESHIRFRITHFQAFASSRRVASSAAMAWRASASWASRSASKAASSKAFLLLLLLLLASSMNHLRLLRLRFVWGLVERERRLQWFLLRVKVRGNGYHKWSTPIFLRQTNARFEIMVRYNYIHWYAYHLREREKWVFFLHQKNEFIKKITKNKSLNLLWERIDLRKGILCLKNSILC